MSEWKPTVDTGTEKDIKLFRPFTVHFWLSHRSRSLNQWNRTTHKNTTCDWRRTMRRHKIESNQINYLSINTNTHTMSVRYWGKIFLIFVNSFYRFSGAQHWQSLRFCGIISLSLSIEFTIILPHLSCHFDWLIKYLDVSLWIDKMYYCASRRFPCNFLSQSRSVYPDDDMMRTMRGLENSLSLRGKTKRIRWRWWV